MGIQSITKNLLALIKSEGRKVSLQKKEIIQSTETSSKLCYIKGGYVKKYMITNEGNVRIQIIYGPGDVFPLSIAFKVLFDQDLYVGPEVYYYETMTHCEMVTLDKDKLTENTRDDVYLYRDLLSEAGRRLYFNIQRLENSSLPSSYQRVAHQITFYAEVFGQTNSRGVKIKLPMTQQDLADVLSTTRETVSLSISELRKKGLIKTERYWLIPDLGKLKEESFSISDNS
ncbi:MAG TPA: Crp/Fnr family transcriptional regulator [Candidatus Saccharimonadales bacterium]|nr:Crp/Fnr family transcriptional regulator [Candidatus Saccharimonadales bacterium]